MSFLLINLIAAAQIMAGFPLPNDQLVTQENWLTPPFNRWSFHNVRRVKPTADIERGDRAPTRLMAGETPLVLEDMNGLFREEKPLGALLEETYTDAFIVLKGGEIVFETYFDREGGTRPHALFSISKSILGTLALILAGQGAIDLETPVSKAIPELAETLYGDATLLDLLNMEVAPSNDENKTPFELESQLVFLPAGISVDEYAPGFKGKREKRFFYSSVTSEVLGWAIERLTGVELSTLLSDKIWRHVGAERNAYSTLDKKGRLQASGGLSITPRDLARFGEMMRKGEFHLANIKGSDTFDEGLFSPIFREGGYRGHWWLLDKEKGVSIAMGIYGQYLYINPLQELVIVKLSSEPKIADLEYSFLTMKLFEAIAKHYEKEQ